MKHFVNINVAGKIRVLVVDEIDARTAQRKMLDWLNTQLAEVLLVQPLAVSERVRIVDAPPAPAITAEPAPPAALPVAAKPAPAPAKPAAKKVRK